MTTPKQPATAAGRALLAASRLGGLPADFTEPILAIEAEAAAGLLALREALEQAGDFAKQTLIDLPDERTTRNVIAHLYRVLADTAPAAAEIEARIMAKAEAYIERVLSGKPRSPAEGADGWDVALYAVQRELVAQWLASPEAEQRLAAALPDALSAMTEGSEYAPAPEPSDEPHSEYVVGLTRAILAALREQPADEAGTDA